MVLLSVPRPRLRTTVHQLLLQAPGWEMLHIQHCQSRVHPVCDDDGEEVEEEKTEEEERKKRRKQKKKKKKMMMMMII